MRSPVGAVEARDHWRSRFDWRHPACNHWRSGSSRHSSHWERRAHSGDRWPVRCRCRCRLRCWFRCRRSVHRRSEKAGKLVAMVLLQGGQGSRHGDAGLGIVERVVLLGTPQNLDKARWESVRKGGSLMACPQTIGFLGLFIEPRLQAVDVRGMENVDLSDMVDGHTHYLRSLKLILQGMDIDSFCATLPHKLQMSGEDKIIAASTAAGPVAQ